MSPTKKTSFPPCNSEVRTILAFSEYLGIKNYDIQRVWTICHRWPGVTGGKLRSRYPGKER